MPIFNKFVDGLLFRGGILVTGIICLYLTKNDFLPRYMNPVSYGLTTLGAFGILLGLSAEEEVNESEDDDYDPNYEDRMKEFQRLRPELEGKINEHTLLMIEYERCKRRWNDIDTFERDSLRFSRVMEAHNSRPQRLQREGMPEEGADSGQHSISPADLPQASGRNVQKRGSLSKEDLAKLTRFYFAF